MGAPAFPLLVSTDWLASRDLRGAAVRLVDARWSHKPPTAAERYAEAHIPGAVFADLDRDLAQAGGPGRHPLPTPAAFAAVLGRLGVGPGTHVVAYDDAGGIFAARLWFMLRAHGHAAASLLDGGLATWIAEGRPVTAEAPEVAPLPPPRLALDPSRVVDRETVLREVVARRHERVGPGRALLLDARAPERYRGDVEPLDKRAGHIPGAVNAPTAANLRGGGDARFRPAAELHARYAALGAEAGGRVIASCGSGVTACHDALALEVAGFAPAAVYIGSWSDWSATMGELIAVGEGAG